MTCLHPREVFDTGRVNPETGKRVLSFSAPTELGRAYLWKSMMVPCGKCSACLHNRRNRWINRLTLEQFISDKATFVTLTYNDAWRPEQLSKYDIQCFLKRLRQASRDFHIPPFKLRYFVCGEYGSKTFRPHYHALLFGVDMMDDCWRPRALGFTLNGRPRYCSDVLERIWPYGFNTVGTVTAGAIRYVSKYVLKQFVDDDKRFQCWTMYSQGLGRGLFVDVVRHGREYDYRFKDVFHLRYSDGMTVLPVDGRYRSIPNPSCLDAYAERFYPALYDAVKSSRAEYARAKQSDMRAPSDRARDLDYLATVEQMKGQLDNE